MKIKWMAIAISLVFTLTFLAAPSWAGRNDRDGRKQGTHVEKPHKPGHPNRHGDSIYSHKHPDRHHSQYGLRSIYAKQHRYHKRVQKHYREYHRYDCYPRQSRTFFGISIYDPWGGFSFQTSRIR